jgi:hypothetical protein
MVDQTPADEMRAAAFRLREAVDPKAVARIIDGTFAVLCSDHDEPALICRNCRWFDAGDDELAALVVALLNARGPLAAWLAETAKMFGRATYEELGHSVHAICGGVVGGAITRCSCFDRPLAVARVLTGSARAIAGGGDG